MDVPEPHSLAEWALGVWAVIAKKQAAIRNADTEKCKADMPALKAHYAELWAQAKYWDAYLSVHNCATLTGDEELKHMVALGQVKDYTLTARNAKAPPQDRIVSITALQRDY